MNRNATCFARALTIVTLLCVDDAVCAQEQPGTDAELTEENVLYDFSSATVQSRPMTAVAVSPASDCELRLFIEQQPGGGTNLLGLFELDRREAGTMVVERLAGDQKTVANGICIKKKGQALHLPASILVASTPSRIEKFCRHEEEIERDYELKRLAPQGGHSGAKVKVMKVSICTWDGTFHSKRPFTITLLSSPDTRVDDYVEYFRVYRNGDLMAAWNRGSDQAKPYRVVIPGAALTTGAFAASQPPHLSAMDIRIIPREGAVARAVDVAVRNDRKRFETRLVDASKAALDIALPPGSPERQSIDCLHDALKRAGAEIQRVVNGDLALPNLAAGCAPLISATGEQPLSEAYSQLKNQSAERLEELRAKAADEIAKLHQQLVDGIPDRQRDVVIKLMSAAIEAAERHAATAPAVAAAKQCVAGVIEPGSAMACVARLAALDPRADVEFRKVVQAVTVIDADIEVVLRTADEALALADELRDSASAIASDPTKQQQIFNSFAQSLASTGEVFEERRENPPLLVGEQRIEMSYSDAWQWFFVAPWNGVPIRVNADTEADLNAAVAVPFVDLVGGRYQWARSRFADARLAFGVGYVSTDKPDSSENKPAMLLNMSLTIGPVKLGAGYAIGNGIGEGADRLRVILGADLFKLASGSNVELF